MINFTKISYDSIALLLQKSCDNWDGSDLVKIDETKLTVEEFALLKRYLEQQGYKQDV